MLTYYQLYYSVVEINVSIIVCSMPGFAKFVRVYGSKWILIASQWSKSSTRGDSDGSSPSKRDSYMIGPNEPATYAPEKPLVAQSVYHSGSHSQCEINHSHGPCEITRPVYYPGPHASQREVVGTHSYYELTYTNTPNPSTSGSSNPDAKNTWRTV